MALGCSSEQSDLCKEGIDGNPEVLARQKANQLPNPRRGPTKEKDPASPDKPRNSIPKGMRKLQDGVVSILGRNCRAPRNVQTFAGV